MNSTAGSTAHNNVTIRLTTHDNHHRLENYDPCLSVHINNISTRTKGNTVLGVTWSSSGDHDQFEIQCKSSLDQDKLQVTAGLTETELHHFQPETNDSICIIPQSENLFKSVAPKTQQCTLGHTGAHTLTQHYNLVLGTSVSITVLILIALIFFAAYKWWLQPIQFQCYYDDDDDKSSSQYNGTDQSKVTKESVYDSLEYDKQNKQQHLYTASYHLSSV